MTKKVWILLAIALLLLLWRQSRERFGATATIKNPSTWNAAEYERIRKLLDPPSTLDDTDIQRIIGGFWSYSIPSQVAGEPAIQKGWSVATNQITLSDINAYLDNAYRTNLAADQTKRAAYRELLKAYYIDQGQSEFQRARDYVPPPSATGATGATGTTSFSGDTVQRPSSSSEALRQEIATAASVPRNDDAKVLPYVREVQRFYDTIYMPNRQLPTLAQISSFVDTVDMSTIPTAMQSNFKSRLAVIIENYFESGPREAGGGGGGTGATGGTALTGASGATGGAGAQMGAGGGTGETEAQRLARQVREARAQAQAQQGTSGGSPQGYSLDPASPLKLYGPQYTEVGSPYDGSGGDGAGDGAGGMYPTLLGGMEPIRYEKMAKNEVPSSGSLGSDTGSMFFPFSRTPGDMDILGDPFRAMNNFSLASYTPKTDPVPFLPDFSAFQK
jgi:hypothetical protein